MTEEQAEYMILEIDHVGTCECDVCTKYWEQARAFTNQKNPGQEPGKKFDAGKTRYDLLPGDVLEEIAVIFTQGAEKYGDHNWSQGMSWGRVFGAAMRHMWAFWTGKTTDQESGRPHLAHAIVNLMFLLAYYIRGVGTDDRRAK